MNSIVVDSSKLAGEANFPVLDMHKYGWQQFMQLEGEDVAEHCWHPDVIISVATPVTRAAIDTAFKLRRMIATGSNTDHIDLAAASQRGIAVCKTPGLDPANAAHCPTICEQVINNLNAWPKKQPVNLITDAHI